MTLGSTGFFKKLQQKIIGEVLDSATDHYERARILLVYNLTMLMLVTLLPIALYLMFKGVYRSGFFTSIALFGLVGVFLLMKNKRTFPYASRLYVFVGALAMILSYLMNLDTLVITNELWFVVLLLFTHFTLGKRWAFGVLIVSISSVLFYNKFLLYDNLHNESIYTPEKLSALMFIAPIAFYLIYYMLNQFLMTRNEAEQLVKASNKNLKRESDEKGAMIKEIHHRVKNNLQIVNSLLRLQSSEVEDEKIVKLFEETQNRVISMALLHEFLYNTDEENIDVQKHFAVLVADLVKSYSLSERVQVELDIQPVSFGVKTAVPLGLIINEIVTNALKHAYAGRMDCKLILRLRHLKEDQYEMIIGDNGVGMIEENVQPHMGMELIHVFTEQLDGEIARLSEPGTLYKLKFKSIDK